MKLIICRDMGAATVISENENKKNCLYFLKNPAKKFFEKKGIISENLKTLEKNIKNCEFIITGTSWPLDIEYRAIKLAKKYNKKITTYLDNWVNYELRFNNKKEMLPDTIITTDIYAFNLAKKKFHFSKVLLKKNLYLENIKKKYKVIVKEKKYILYVDNHLVDVNKNIINKKRNSKQIFLHEKAIFENFVKKIKSHNIRSKKILFRTHPKKKIENSLKIIKKYKSICSISKNDDLFKDIAKSEIVVGWNSMAMFIADKLGKKVMHILPKGIKENKLPIKNIMYLE